MSRRRVCRCIAAPGRSSCAQVFPSAASFHRLFCARCEVAADLAFEDREQRFARACDTAFHRADRAMADRSGIFVGKSARADEDRRLALLVRKLVERARRIGQFRRPGLSPRSTGNAFGRVLIPGRLAPCAPAIRIELVAQDREQPRFEIGAGREHVARLPGLDERLLREIVGGFLIAAERARKGAQKWNELQKTGLELAIGSGFGVTFAAAPADSGCGVVTILASSPSVPVSSILCSKIEKIVRHGFLGHIVINATQFTADRALPRPDHPVLFPVRFFVVCSPNSISQPRLWVAVATTPTPAISLSKTTAGRPPSPVPPQVRKRRRVPKGSGRRELFVLATVFALG